MSAPLLHWARFMSAAPDQDLCRPDRKRGLPGVGNANHDPAPLSLNARSLGRSYVNILRARSSIHASSARMGPILILDPQCRGAPKRPTWEIRASTRFQPYRVCHFLLLSSFEHVGRYPSRGVGRRFEADLADRLGTRSNLEGARYRLMPRFGRLMTVVASYVTIVICRTSSAVPTVPLTCVRVAWLGNPGGRSNWGNIGGAGQQPAILPTGKVGALTMRRTLASTSSRIPGPMLVPGPR